MSEKAKMLRQLSAHQFAVWELHLYLDTHCNDKNAQSLLESHRAEYEKLKTEYEKLYGELDQGTGNCSQWLSAPWPWENEGDEC